MEISFSANGDKQPIPLIKEGNFLKLIGPNGIGKSTAADFLEIAFGDYNFKDKGYENIKESFIDCDIKFKTENDEFEMIITPGTWKYIKSEFKLEEDSIGTCIHNGKKINPNELRNIISVKVIRGDEDLEKQIKLVSSMFNVIINNRLNDCNKYLEILDNYLKKFEEETRIDLIKEYQKHQEEYAAIEKEHLENIQNHDIQRRNVISDEIALDLINKIIIWEEHNPEELNPLIEKITSDIDHYQNELNTLIIKIERFERTLSAIDKKRRDELNKIFEDLNKIRKDKSDLIRKIQKDFPHEWENIQNADSNEKIEQIHQIKLNRLKSLQKMVDETQKGTIKLIELLITKFTLIVKLLDECREEGLGNKLILEIIHNENELKLSIEEFRNYLDERIDILKSDPRINSMQFKLEEIGNNLIILNKMIEYLNKWKKCIDNERSLLTKKAELTQNITLEKYMEPQLERNLKIIDRLIDEQGQIRNHLDHLIAEKVELENRIKETENLEPYNELKENLTSMLTEMPADLRDKREEMENNLAENKENLIILKNKLNDLNDNLQNKEQVITNLKNEIIKIANSNGYIDFSEWISYVENHINKTQIIMKKLDDLTVDLQSIQKKFTKIEYNESFTKRERDEFLKLVSEVYNQYFLETYKDEEFFKYVFKGYEEIRQFDVINKIIIFVKKNGRLDQRKLKEFSSGEKAYAFIRAMILLSRAKSNYNVLIVDEAYALMDYMRSGDLIEFQKELIRNNSYDKIINIIAMVKEPEELNEQEYEEYNKFGYYHELIDI